MKDKEKELEIIMGTYLEIDDEDNITGFNFDKAIKDIITLIQEALTTQKEAFIKIIESKREYLIHHDCLVDKNTKCDCGAYKWLDDIKAELERRG